MLTQKDKTAMLERLLKSVRQWEVSRSLPVVLFLGKSELSSNSPTFQEWREKASEAIELIFGEHSHHLADFNEIEYSDILTALLQDKKASETKFWEGVGTAKRMLESMIKEIKTSESLVTGEAARVPLGETTRGVFVGHGRNPLWLAVRSFLEHDCGLAVVCFESKPRTSESIVSIVEGMLEQVNFAVIVMTAEDATADGQMRARENVVHEAGLSQGKLGFKKVVIVKQEGLEVPSNLAGLQCISFTDNKVSQAFYDLRLSLKNAGLIS